MADVLWCIVQWGFGWLDIHVYMCSRCLKHSTKMHTHTHTSPYKDIWTLNTQYTHSRTPSHINEMIFHSLTLSNTLNFCIPFYFPSNELYRDNVRGALSHSDRISHFMPFAVAEFRIGKKLNGFFAFPFHSLSLLSLFKCGKCSLHTSVCVCVCVCADY